MLIFIYNVFKNTWGHKKALEFCKITHKAEGLTNTKSVIKIHINQGNYERDRNCKETR